jgi:hypothetical protein
MMQYVFNQFLAIDQLLNTILMGHPDETLSSRLGRTIGKERYFFVRPLRVTVDLIFYPIEKDHCLNSVMHLEQMNFRDFDYEVWSWSHDD